MVIRENEASLKREQMVMDAIKKDNWIVKKLGKFDVDYLIQTRGKQYLCEIKTYRSRFGAFPKQMLSLNKISKVQSDSKMSGCIGMFVLAYSCGTIAFIEVDKIKGEFKLGGYSTPRAGNVNDVELMCFVDIKDLQISKHRVDGLWEQ